MDDVILFAAKALLLALPLIWLLTHSGDSVLRSRGGTVGPEEFALRSSIGIAVILARVANMYWEKKRIG